MPKINGITKKSLWTSWRNVRKRFSGASIRDVTDFVEYDLDPDWWIARLLADLKAGRYEPATAYRYSIAKRMGFSRRMTFPSIPDLVLYRAIVDHLYSKAKRFEREHVYFAQNTLSKKQKQVTIQLAASRSGTAVEGADPGYTFVSGNAYLAWLEYDQYRKYLLLDKIYAYIVTTDITNFFDTVLYDRIAAALHEIQVDRNLVGLLFFLLERLSIRDAFNESPRIGLPVDEFDCSRTLAHIVLFPHDDRMVKFVGEGAYVRWMDDQNFGAATFSKGLAILRQCGDSLSRLHLTPNAAKSRIMSLRDANRHFHLDVNAALDAVEKMPTKTRAQRNAMRSAFMCTWRRFQRFDGTGGEWGKVLKRVYRFAGISGARFLRRRALKDLLAEPTLTGRIAGYMRATGTASEYLAFVQRVWTHNDQVYPDVNYLLAEGLLKLEPAAAEVQTIRKIASDLLSSKCSMPGAERCAALAPLLILRYGDRRSVPLLRRLVRCLEGLSHPAVAKAVVAVYVSYGIKEYKDAISAASQMRNNYLAPFLSMLAFTAEYDKVPDRFRVRRDPVYDAVAGRSRVDIRRLLALRLLCLNRRKAIRQWLGDTRDWMIKQDISEFDKRLVTRLLS